MIAKVQIKAFSIALSTIMLFITFFYNYTLYSFTLVNSFIRGVFTYIITYIVITFLFLLWTVTYSPKEWKKIVAEPLNDVDNREENLEIDEMEELLADV